MAQQTMQAFVVLNGRVDNTFGAIGEALVGLGTTIDQISRKLIDFGKDSLNVYQDYELSMREAENALATKYGKGTRELADVMKQLDRAASHWANTTIFHTNDVANAIYEAAKSGWDFETIMSGIPAAMHLAEIGGVDLSDAIGYIGSAMKASKIPMEEMTDFIDEWAYAANTSLGDVRTFGEALKKMGASTQFADSKEELLAMLALIHDVGTESEAAGTLARNAMIRIIAPSGVGSKILSFLGADQEMLDGIMEDRERLAALKQLELAGFSVADANGRIKPMQQIYQELGEALDKIIGKEKDLSKNKTALDIFSNIFGVRTTQGALALVQYFKDAAEKGNTLYNDLMSGAAKGYSEFASQNRMDTLYGSMEIFESKIENIQKLVGEHLAPDVRSLQEYLGGMLDKIAEMDPDKMQLFITALKDLAVAGGTFIAAGSIMRLIGYIATLPGALSLLTIGLGSLAGVLNDLESQRFMDMFGDMSLDSKTLLNYIATLGEEYETAYQSVDRFSDALDSSVKNYEKASAAFSSDLLNALLTKKEFTEPEREALEEKGREIYQTVVDAITASGSMATEFWKALFGGGENAEGDPIYNSLIETLNRGQEDELGEAETVAQRLREALLKGFEEGFTEDDYDKILGLFEEFNTLIARAQNEALTEEQFINQQKMLRKAQTASFSEVKQIGMEATQERDKVLSEMSDRFETERARLIYYNGGTEQGIEAELKEAEARYNQQKSKYAAGYDEFLLTLWETTARESGLSSEYNDLARYADLYLSGGDWSGAYPDFLEKYGVRNGVRGNMNRLLGNMVASFGGEMAMLDAIDNYNATGNTDMANRLRRLLWMEQTSMEGMQVGRTDRAKWDFMNWFGDFGYSYPLTSERSELMRRLFPEGEAPTVEFEATVTGLDEAAAQAQQSLDETPLDEPVVAVPDMSSIDTTRSLYEQYIQTHGLTWTIGADGTAHFPGMATGGRATSPVIFGEAGPEWFIPEEKSPRTAALLMAAAKASGFNFTDLARMWGARLFAEGGQVGSSLNWSGLSSSSADAGSLAGGIQVQYSPVIHADNAQGVESALREDKERFERWINDWWEKREVYSHAAGY